MQIPYLARHCRVLTFDGRGNGRSDRPAQPEAYAENEFAADALAVMDATQTARAIIVGFSMGAHRGLLLAGNHPERVEAAVFIGPNYPGGGQPIPEQAVYSWEEELDTEEGWAKHHHHYCLRDFKGYLEFFMSRMFTEPHSTKPIEDGVGWGLDTTPETLALTYLAPFMEPEEARELAGRVRCPVLVIHGESDGHTSVTRGVALAEHTGGRLVLLEGSFHAPHVRDPVRVNLLLRDFIKPAPPPRRWVRGRSRRERALYISSPIGLGHAQRDVAHRRASCANSIPTSRSTGSPSTRSRRCWRPPVSASTRQARCWPTNQATSAGCPCPTAGARGVPDRRLQRRDDRAHRPLSPCA